MQLLVSRKYPIIDADTLTESMGRDTLLRAPDGRFLLYMTNDGVPSRKQEHIVALRARDAILWLNQEPDDFGSFWPD